MTPGGLRIWEAEGEEEMIEFRNLRPTEHHSKALYGKIQYNNVIQYSTIQYNMIWYDTMVK